MTPERQPESRVPVYAAVVMAALLHLALPEQIAPGPSWIPVAITVPLIVPQVITRACHNQRMARKIGTLTMVALTIFLVGALGTLIYRVVWVPPNHHEATLILRAAIPLWVGNIVLFALWYWRLDAGGPHIREGGHNLGHGFVFPQMTLDDDLRARLCQPNWRPMFIDYVFLAFNTSTALSPTDTAVVAGWAKALSMIQSLVSLSLLVLVAARAVNIL